MATATTTAPTARSFDMLPEGALVFFSADGKTWGLERHVNCKTADEKEAVPIDKRATAEYVQTPVGDFWHYVASDTETVNAASKGYRLFVSSNYDRKSNTSTPVCPTLKHVPKSATHVRIVMNENRCKFCSGCTHCGSAADTVCVYPVPPDGTIHVVGERHSFLVTIDRQKETLQIA